MATPDMVTKSSPRRSGDYSSSQLKSGAVTHSWSVPSPRAIIFLQHGFGEYAERYVDQFNRLIPEFNHAGYEVHALDMWGHGRSPGARSLVDVQRAVQDHVEMRQRASGSALPVFLFGHSLGGLVTAGSCVASSKKLAGVILTGPALAALPPLPARWLVSAISSLTPAAKIPARPGTPAGLSHSPEVQSRVESDPLMFKGQISFLVASTALKVAEVMWKSLGDWKTPTLVLHGVADTYTDPEQSRRFVDGIASEDKTLHLVDGGLHELLHDTTGDEMLKIVLDWIAERI